MAQEATTATDGPEFMDKRDSLVTLIAVRKRVIARLERDGDPDNEIAMHKAHIATHREDLKQLDAS